MAITPGDTNLNNTPSRGQIRSSDFEPTPTMKPRSKEKFSPERCAVWIGVAVIGVLTGLALVHVIGRLVGWAFP